MSAKGAAMMVRKNVFEKLGMFDEKFIISFEDVDLGWRCWIYGYEVILVANSIVYHYGGGTISKTDIDIDFHGAKNHLIMKLTNFEGNFMWKKIINFLLIYGLRQTRVWIDYKIHGRTGISATKHEKKISKKPNLKSILKATIWILKNRNYLKKRMKDISSKRLNSTKYLEEKSLILPK